MRTVTFQGASDDLIEIEGCPGADEFTAGKNDAGVFRLASSEGELLVRVAYERNGCWSVGFLPSDEDVPVPPWPVAFSEPINTYTACLAIDCPDDVTLTLLDES